MKGTVGLLVLAALLYFGLRTEAPTPEEVWQPYALNNGTSKLEWVTLRGVIG